MTLLHQLVEMSSEKGAVAKAIRAAMKKHGVTGQRVLSRNHESGDMARGSYSDKRKGGRAVKVYVDDVMSKATQDGIKYEILKTFPEASVTFGPGKRLHGYSDMSPWIRVNIKEGMNESADEKVYGMFSKGGSIGAPSSDKPIKTGTREDMKYAAKRMRKTLSPGERKYYGMGYTVRPLKAGERAE